MSRQGMRRRVGFWILGMLAVAASLVMGPEATWGWQDSGLDAAIRAGEFTTALAEANRLEGNARDAALGSIARSQIEAGANLAAVQTVRSIREDQLRTRVLGNLFRAGGTQGDGADRSGGGTEAGSNDGARGETGVPPGQGGGITIGDFQPLMDLIKSTIAPDSWDDSNGDGTLFPYVAGVHVDAAGQLRKVDRRPDRVLERVRQAAREDGGNREAGAASRLRKVSLTRLERELQILRALGLPPTREMECLAGLTEVEYLLFYPESGDIVIAGPAGGIARGAEGRWVNPANGRPVLKLDDLVNCLRNAFYEEGRFGCSIEPRQANLASTRQFVSSSALTGRPWREALREQLGEQDIVVFGLDPRTHTARVIVEADYRMKLVAMGLEPGVAGVPSYLERLELDANGAAPPLDVVRWWFTMNYDSLTSDADGLAYSLNGIGVKVLSENEMLDATGQRIKTGQSDPHTAGFAADFTRHFDELADRYPAYRQLQNVFDMALVAALIRDRGLDQKVGWDLTYFGQPGEGGEPVYEPRLDRPMREVESVMNHRVIRFERDSRAFKTTLVGVSGGVRFDAREWLKQSQTVTDREGKLADQQLDSKPDGLGENHWWWD